MKKLFAAVLTLTLLAISSAAASESFTVEAKAAVLIDAASGRILFAQNADEMLPMASTTKIMTAVLALENCALNETVTAGKNAHGVEGTSIYLSEGEQLSMEHMLYGLMLRSGNDAAVAIAEHVSGSVSSFAEAMNARARELDADANFVNPHGLPADGHAASALGLARIMRHAMTLPEFRTITATTRKVIPWVGNDYSRVLENKNRLLTTYSGATGGKTGYTKAAGRCLVFSAEREGLSLIGVVLGCPTWFETAKTLLDYGFENYRSTTVLRRGDIVGPAPLSRGTAKTVSAVAANDLASAIGTERSYSLHYDYADDLTAPIQKGQIVGIARLVSEGETLSTCPLLAARDVPERNLRETLRRVLRRWLLAPI